MHSTPTASSRAARFDESLAWAIRVNDYRAERVRHDLAHTPWSKMIDVGADAVQVTTERVILDGLANLRADGASPEEAVAQVRQDAQERLVREARGGDGSTSGTGRLTDDKETEVWARVLDPFMTFVPDPERLD